MANIKCIYCGTSYNVDTSNFKQGITKFRCAQCKKVFAILSDEIADPGSMLDKEKEEKEIGQNFAIDEEKINDGEYIPDEEKKDADAPYISNADANADIIENEPEEKQDKQEMGEIFDRLNKRVEEDNKLDAEQSSFADKTIKASGIKKAMNIVVYLLLFLVICILSINYYRYEITRKLPMMEMFFSNIGIESKVLGEGLEFINVEKNLFEEDYIKKMEIKGYINNTTQETLDIPAIYASLLNEDADTLHETKVFPAASILGPNARIAFRVVITKPSPYGKYVYLTFTKDKDDKKTKKEPL